MPTITPDESATTGSDPDDRAAQAARLAELVAGLTGCEPTGALHAVREQAGPDAEQADALAVVARAMVEVDLPPPPGFRLARYVAPEDGDDAGDGVDPAPPPR